MIRRTNNTTPQGAANTVVDPRTQALRDQRDALAERVAEATWDLGGLTYEMAVRDYFRLDVLVRRAAKLQELDAELGEVERLLLLQETGTTGGCRSCGAPHSRGAVYCWKCGQPLMLQAHVVSGSAEVLPAPAGPTDPRGPAIPATAPVVDPTVADTNVSASA